MEDEGEILSETNLFKMYCLPTARGGPGSLYKPQAQTTTRMSMSHAKFQRVCCVLARSFHWCRVQVQLSGCRKMALLKSEE